MHVQQTVTTDKRATGTAMLLVTMNRRGGECRFFTLQWFLFFAIGNHNYSHNHSPVIFTPPYLYLSMSKLNKSGETKMYECSSAISPACWA